MVETFLVYSRRDCHLCDVLIDELRDATTGYPVNVTVVDVDSDPALVARYGARVPVLVANEEEICHFHLARDRVIALLAGD